MTPRRAYRTDLSDARWALAGPILAAWRAARAEAGLGLSEPVHDLREIVNAILYVNRTGIAWEYLPHDFPPYKSGGLGGAGFPRNLGRGAVAGGHGPVLLATGALPVRLAGAVTRFQGGG
jgi:hypothetical protein